MVMKWRVIRSVNCALDLLVNQEQIDAFSSIVRGKGEAGTRLCGR